MTRSPLRRLVFGALHRLLYLWVRSETINQSAFNMGNALGAYLGGLPIAFGYGIASADVVGAVMAMVGVAIAGAMLAYQR